MKALKINAVSLVIDNDKNANAALQQYLSSHAVKNMKFVIWIAFLYAIVTCYAYFLSKRASQYSLILNLSMLGFWSLSFFLTARFPSSLQYFITFGFIC